MSKPLRGWYTIADLKKNYTNNKIFITGVITNYHDLELELNFFGSQEKLIESAYLKWGQDFIKKLLGDFIIVVWDAKKSNLLCYRDRIGVKPFYYRTINDQFIFSTELHEVAFATGETPSTDEETICQRIIADYSNTTRTLYQNIYRLSSAHFLVFNQEGIRISRYWKDEFGPQIRYQNSNDYGDHLQELLIKSLTSRFSSTQKLGMLASGGFDSSALTSILHKKLHFSVEGFTFKTNDANTENEVGLNYLRTLKDFRLTEVNGSNPNENILIHHLFESQLADIEYNPTFFFYRPLYRAAKAAGMSMILTGSGGDDIFTTNLSFLSDLFLSGKWSTLFLEIKNRKYHGIALSNLVLQNLIKPLVPIPLVKYLRIYSKKRFTPVLCSERLKQFQFFRASAEKHYELRLTGTEKWRNQLYHRLFVGGGYAHSYEQEYLLTQFDDVSVSHPLFDWNVIDFAFRLPIEELHLKSKTKIVFRNSVRDCMPLEIRDRRDNQNYDALSERMICEQKHSWEQWLKEPILSKLGIVDYEEFEKLWYNRAVGNQNLLFCLWSLEGWLRKIQTPEFKAYLKRYPILWRNWRDHDYEKKVQKNLPITQTFELR